MSFSVRRAGGWMWASREQRARAVRATIEASTGLLDGQDAERFAELGVFAEDETIPFGLVARLWRATAGLDDLRAAQVCKRLAQLALVSQASRASRRRCPA